MVFCTCGAYSYLSGRSKTGQMASSVFRTTLAPSFAIHSALLAVLSSKDKGIQSEKMYTDVTSKEICQTNKQDMQKAHIWWDLLCIWVQERSAHMLDSFLRNKIANL